MNMTRRLLTSIHDVTPHLTDRLDRIVPVIEGAVGPGNYAMLVVPDYHHQGKLSDHPAFLKRLRDWSDQGVEMFLHGYTHIDESVHESKAAQLKAQRMTAGEGEFLGLDYADATKRLIEGRKMVEDATGKAVTGFIAPAWLYGEESLRAIADQDFPMIENHFRVWSPNDNRLLTRGPVLTYASRTVPRMLSSILWSRISTIILSRASVVRFAVHPHDVDSPSLIREIKRAIASFLQSHQPAPYAALL
jgi:uncharacterized protein